MAAILKNTVPGVVGRAPHQIMFLYDLTDKYANFGALDQRVTISSKFGAKPPDYYDIPGC